MRAFQKLGGCVALFGAAKIVLGIGVLLTFLAPTGYATGEADAALFVAFLVKNQAVMSLWKLVIWIIWGVLLVVLVLALNQRLKKGAPVVSQIATALGLIWAGLEIAGGMIAIRGLNTVVGLYSSDPDQAASVWLGLDSVERGIGDGNLIVGGLWVMLVSRAALQAGELRRPLNHFGVAVGAAGLLAYIPPFSGLGVVFGFGLILWFALLGIIMLRGEPGPAA